MKSLNIIQRQATLGQLFHEAGVSRMAIYHFKKTLDLYDKASDDVKKASLESYKYCKDKLAELEKI